MRKSHKPGGAEWLCGSVRKENARLSVRGCLLWLGEKKRAPNYSWNSLKLLPSGFTFYAGWPWGALVCWIFRETKRNTIFDLGDCITKKTNKQPAMRPLHVRLLCALVETSCSGFFVCVCSFARCLCVCCVPYALRVLRV